MKWSASKNSPRKKPCEGSDRVWTRHERRASQVHQSWFCFIVPINKRTYLKLLNRTGKWIYALTSCLNKTGNLGKFKWWKLVHDLLNCLSGTRSSWMMPPLLKQTAFKGTWTPGMTYKVFCVCVSKVLFVVLSSQTIPDFTLYLWSYGVMTMTWWSLATSVCQSCG